MDYNEHCSVREVRTINTVVTSREAILKTCREIVSEKGLQALNMRMVAQSCHVALGSLYNYFPSKNDLIVATIESVWQDIFHMEHCYKTELSFVEYVSWIFESVQRGAKEYPNFFTTHSISAANSGKSKARETMEFYFSHMKKGMLSTLENDPEVRKNAFDGDFTESAFIDFVLTNILVKLIQRDENSGVLNEIICRTIYKG